MEAREYTENGVKVREEMVPHMYVIVETYTPHSCPWDYYGMKKCHEWKAVMKEAGIPCQTLHTRKSGTKPFGGPGGTGPGGRVRMGDNMMPGLYRLCVPKHCVGAAQAALNEHKRQINLWLDGHCDMPTACRH